MNITEVIQKKVVIEAKTSPLHIVNVNNEKIVSMTRKLLQTQQEFRYRYGDVCYIEQSTLLFEELDIVQRGD